VVRKDQHQSNNQTKQNPTERARQAPHPAP
jgi:hypothetical protein